MGNGDGMFRYRYLVAAVVLALVGTGLTGMYIQRLAQEATGQGPTKQVVVAKTAIPKGTEMQSSLVDTKMWPVAMVPPGAVTQLPEVDGRFSLVDLVPGEIILANRLVVQEEQSLAWQLAPGERALVVSVSGLDGLEAEITPGSRVDILGTLLDYRTGLEHSLLVLENIALLDIVTDESPYGSALGDQKVILAVSPQQAKKLALFDSAGSLQLLLRPNGASEYCREDELALTTKDILDPRSSQGEGTLLDEIELTYPASADGSLESAEPNDLRDIAKPGNGDQSIRKIEVIRGTTASLETASARDPALCPGPDL